MTALFPPNWSWTAGAGYTPAMRIGQLLLTSGIAPFDEQGRVVSEDFETQARQVVANLAQLLAHAGSGLDRIVRQHVYLKREEDVARFTALRRELYRPPYPASVLVVVTAHAHPDMLIEIACEALVSETPTGEPCLRLGPHSSGSREPKPGQAWHGCGSSSTRT